MKQFPIKELAVVQEVDVYIKARDSQFAIVEHIKKVLTNSLCNFLKDKGLELGFIKEDYIGNTIQQKMFTIPVDSINELKEAWEFYQEVKKEQ